MLNESFLRATINRKGSKLTFNQLVYCSNFAVASSTEISYDVPVSLFWVEWLKTTQQHVGGPPAVTSEDIVKDFLIREFVPHVPADVDSVLSNGNCFRCFRVETRAVVDRTRNRNHVAHGGPG